MTPRDEPERDAWLGEALRHAPDANAAPPASVSETILRQARHAVKTPAAVPRAHPWSRAWSWLGRPPVAAGFATVMVAAVVGVMWWDRPLDEALPPPARAVAPVAPGAPVASTAEVDPPATTTTPAPLRNEPRPVDRADRASPRAAAKAAIAPPPTAPAPRREQAPETVEATAPPAAAPAPESRARAADDTSLSRSMPAQAFGKAAPAAAPATRQQGADSPTPLGEPAERWTWQRAGGPQPMTPALQRWLAQLSRAARWRPADAPPPPAAGGDVLQLSRDGVRHSTIQLGDETAWLTLASGAVLTAPLPAATAAALRASLTDAAP